MQTRGRPGALPLSAPCLPSLRARVLCRQSCWHHCIPCALVFGKLWVRAQGRVRFGKSALLARALAVMLCSCNAFFHPIHHGLDGVEIVSGWPASAVVHAGYQKVLAKFCVAAMPPLLAARRS